MINKLLLSLFVLIYAVGSAYGGGPWTLPKNSIYLQLGFNIIAENNRLFYLETDDLLLHRAITDQTISFYGEYSITDKFSLTVDLPFKLTQNSEKIFEPDDPFKSEQGDLNGLGNLVISPKYQLYNKNIVMAMSLDISFPTASMDQNLRLSTGYDSYGFQPNLSLGYSKTKWYSFAQMGYNYRDKLSDQFKLSMEAGYKVFDKVYVIFAIDILQPTSKEVEKPNDFLYLYQDFQQYYAGTLKLSSTVWKNMGVNLHMTMLTINANYVQKGPALGGSIYWKF